MFVHNIDPVLFSIGPLEIRYYGLAYVIGFLLAYWFLARAAETSRIKDWSKEAADELVLWLMVGGVLGGRLGYFLFYSPATFFADPLQVLLIWQGGMSFHGGLIGVIMAVMWFIGRHELDFYDVADILVLPAAIGLGIGRVANFINGEIVGTQSNVPWCFEFPGYDGCRHPVQLYLSLKNFAVAGLLWYFDREERKPGFLFWNFIFLYGIGRFLIDFVRADPILFWVSTGQWLCLAMALVGGGMLWKKY